MAHLVKNALDALSKYIEQITPSADPSQRFTRQADPSKPLVQSGQMRRFDFAGQSISVQRMTQPQHYQVDLIIGVGYFLRDSQRADALISQALDDYIDIFNALAPRPSTTDWSAGLLRVRELGDGSVSIVDDDISSKRYVEMTIPLQIFVIIR